MLSNSSTRYGSASRVFHGLCGIAVIAALVFIEIKSYFPKGSDTRALMQYAHTQAGLCVLALIVPRFLWRLNSQIPNIDPPLHRLMAVLSSSMHYVLYGLMLALPILGFLTIEAEGHSIALFGMHLPTLVAADPGLKKTLKSIHELLGNVMLYLVIVHVLAALWHHFFIKDNTLTRMFGR